jgi:bacterioferritin-associated ferredoxin
MSTILIGEVAALYICICNAVTDRQVQECARAGIASIEELTMHTGVGTCCGRCRDTATQLLERFAPSAETQP